VVLVLAAALVVLLASPVVLVSPGVRRMLGVLPALGARLAELLSSHASSHAHELYMDDRVNRCA
jgi:hypothetical protein